MLLAFHFHDFMKQNTINNNHQQKDDHKPDKPPDVGPGISIGDKVADLRRKKFHAGILEIVQLKERMLLILSFRDVALFFYKKFRTILLF